MKPTALPIATSHRPPSHDGLRRFGAALRIIHPFPTLLNVAATAGLSFVAVRGTPPAGPLTRMLLLMLCAQSAIGVANDVFDRELDAETKPWKPLVSGAASTRFAVAIAALLVATTVALAATLGAAGFALALLGLACGLAYDARLKRTVFSPLPFMIAIPTLPLWVWATLGAWHDALWWLLPLGALIGLSLHLANTLPDLDDDAAHGVRGLAHRLGAQRSMVMAWASFAAALTLTIAIMPAVDYDVRLYTPSVLFAAGSLAVSVIAWSIRRDAMALQLGFGALGIGSAVAAVGWLASVT